MYGRRPCQNNKNAACGNTNRINTNRMAPNHTNASAEEHTKPTDRGPAPLVLNIEKATKENNTFRTALWTGNHLQLTLMSIKSGEDIGLENHPNLDQFLRIEQGEGLVKMGGSQEKLNLQQRVSSGSAIIIPAGTWHNLINTGKQPLKLYSIYAPPQHPKGTVHKTKEDAIAAETH
ncbi:MAG: cupin domain-containing protein [Oscillospiraceae bacterium]|nr:cupin domain-containing protein [Oscillospiraceae bacterium]